MDELTGQVVVEFTNGEIRTVDVDYNIVDGNGHPVYLIDKNRKYYNWVNIISVTKALRSNNG